jgi:uroporphyrinogen-III synthase
LIGAFGGNTSKAVEDAGLNLHIKAPEPLVPSMVAALEKFLSERPKSK